MVPNQWKTVEYRTYLWNNKQTNKTQYLWSERQPVNLQSLAKVYDWKKIGTRIEFMTHPVWMVEALQVGAIHPAESSHKLLILIFIWWDLSGVSSALVLL